MDRGDRLFPPGFPWWALMVVFMIGTGYFQNWVRNQFYWYKQELAAHPEFIMLSEEERSQWWAEHRGVQPGRYNELDSDAAGVLDTWTRQEIVMLDNALMFVFMGIFFTLDALFLRVCGARKQLPFLTLIYFVVGGTLGVMMIVKTLHPTVWDIDGGLLPFLMSPMPSFLLVLFPWMLRKSQAPGIQS